MYLIYDTENEAWERSATEGALQGLAYYKAGKGSKYISAPKLTASGKWALPVDGYNLSDAEILDLVENVTFPEPLEET